MRVGSRILALVGVGSAAALVAFAPAAGGFAHRAVGGWTADGVVANGGDAALAGNAIAVADDGTGVVAWSEYPDQPHFATFSAAHALSRAPFSAQARLVPQASGDLLALDGGGAELIGEANPNANGFSLATQAVGGVAGSSRVQVLGAGDNREADAGVMGVAPNGRRAVLGETPDNAVLSVAAPHGAFDAPVLLSASGTLTAGGTDAPATAMAVAVDDAGDVVAAWVLGGELQARWRMADGRLGAVQSIARVHSQVWLAMALSAAGRAALVWESQDDRDLARPGPASSATTIEAATASLGGEFDTPAQLDSFAATGALAGPADVTLAVPPVVAVAFIARRPVAIWTGHNGSGFAVRATNLDRPAAAHQTVSAANTDATLGSLAVGPRGAIIAWTAVRYAGRAPGQIFANTAQCGLTGPFGAPSPVPGSGYAGTDYSAPVAVTIDPSTGRAWLAGAGPSGIHLFTHAAP